LRTPERIIKYRFGTHGLVTEALPFVSPSADEVVVEVAGVALGADPNSEITGRVVATGAAASEWIDRPVLVPRLLPCGECVLCRRGRPAHCVASWPRAGLASHERVPVRFLCALIPPLWPPGTKGLDFALYAGLAGTLSAPYAALAQVGVEPNALWLLSGGGTSGFAARLAALFLLRSRGAKVVFFEEQMPRRRKLEALGAHAVSGGDEEVLSQLDAWARTQGVEPAIQRLLDFGDGPSERAQALRLLSPGAIALFLEGERGSIPLDLQRLTAGELVLSGVGPCHPDLLPEICACVARGELPLSELVAEVGLSGAHKARMAFLRGESERLPILRL
jgi:6-hydroxycyclohex-1-ene-1-carbonyl-CoA dehydrogenase